MFVYTMWNKFPEDCLFFIQECFNSPYGHVHFPLNAEHIEFKQGEKYNVEASKSESVKVLSEAAKTEGVWLLGGPHDDRLYAAPP